MAIKIGIVAAWMTAEINLRMEIALCENMFPVFLAKKRIFTPPVLFPTLQKNALLMKRRMSCR